MLSKAPLAALLLAALCVSVNTLPGDSGDWIMRCACVGVFVDAFALAQLVDGV
jgi:hypothetical protein